MGLGAAVIVLGTLLPWVRAGDRRRHSYDVFELVERLGFAPDGWEATALRWWPVVPLLVMAAVVLGWWGWPRAGGAVGVAGALYAGGTALAVHASSTPGAGAVDVEAAPIITAAGALVLLAGSVAALVAGCSRRINR